MLNKKNNDNKIIFVNTTKVKCCGSAYPFDHPHIYLALVKGKIICPYCSTTYIYKN